MDCGHTFYWWKLLQLSLQLKPEHLLEHRIEHVALLQFLKQTKSSQENCRQSPLPVPPSTWLIRLVSNTSIDTRVVISNLLFFFIMIIFFVVLLQS